MHEGVWCKKNVLLQNDSSENLDNFSNITFDIFKELSAVIFCVHFILLNVADTNLKIICTNSTEK